MQSMSYLTHLLNKPRLLFCLRATVNAPLAFGLAHNLAVPLNGLWAVLTAVVVIQISIGGSLRAAADYIVGTIGGAVYAGADDQSLDQDQGVRSRPCAMPSCRGKIGERAIPQATTCAALRESKASMRAGQEAGSRAATPAQEQSP